MTDSEIEEMILTDRMNSGEPCEIAWDCYFTVEWFDCR